MIKNINELIEMKSSQPLLTNMSMVERHKWKIIKEIQYLMVTKRLRGADISRETGFYRSDISYIKNGKEIERFSIERLLILLETIRKM